MTWFAFKGLNNGKAINLAGVQEKIATGEGFHGYATEAQAESNPNSVNVLTQGEADLLISDYNAAIASGAQPGGPNASNPAGAALQSVASSIGLGNVDNFFHSLSQSSTWIRVGEVAAGLMVLYAALKALTTPAGANPVHRTFKQTALKIAAPPVRIIAKRRKASP